MAKKTEKKGYYSAEIIQKFKDALNAARARIAAGEIVHVSISHGNTKTGPVASVSLLPFITCPAICRNTCGPLCYAAKLANLRPTVLNAWAMNTAILMDRPAQFWEEVNAAICAVRYFRYHVAGDIPTPAYFAEMIRSAQNHPETEILAFTKRFDTVNAALTVAPLPGNLHILFSGWTNLQPENPHNLPETNVYSKGSAPDENWKQCGGNCFSCACRGVGCWTACPGDTIAFQIH